MHELLPLERHLFLGILIVSVIASVLAHIQIVRDDTKFRRSLIAFTSVQVSLATVLLMLRAVNIKAFPITGVFESMLVLMVFIGITFLFLSAFMQQVWFLSIMAWVLLVITLLTATVAKPAAALQEAARTPWAVVHALAMSLAGAMVVFSAAMSILYLWSQKRLKSNKFLKLFGKMPAVEKLEKLNLLGLQLSFALLTFGFVSGVGLIAVKSAGLGMSMADWLMDSKIVLIAVAWVVLSATLALKYLLGFRGKKVAWATLLICFLILFAFIGSKIFGKSGHDFEKQTITSNQRIQRLYADSTDRHQS